MSTPFSTNNPGIGGLEELTTSEEEIIESIATLGTSGQVLTVDGAGTGVEWTTAGGGDVSKVGTPVNNQVGVWTGDGTLEGDTAFTFDTTTDTLTVPNIAEVNNVAFNITPTPPSYAEGNVYWDETDKTLIIEQGVDNVKLQVGQEMYIRARNATGATITNGSVVYISGQTGNRPNVTLAQANAAATSENLGVATHDIENNTDGLVSVFGLVRGLDTSSFIVGDVVYLSSSVAGGFTSTPPVSPNFVIKIGRIITSNVSTGVLLVFNQDFHEGFVSFDDVRIHGTTEVTALTASELIATDASKNLQSLAVATYPSLTELTYVKGVTSAIQTQIGNKAPTTSPTFATSITGSYLTASEVLITDASKNIVSAPVATYPSLTELTYVKGVTSAIQTQLNAKAATLSGTINEIAYFDSSSTIASLAVATYPSLTELSYVKGVTSAIQTQLNAKQATITFGTGVETALGVNVGTAGSIVVNGGALSTPSSGTVTNLTGTASININGTVGATTPGTGAFTTLSASSTLTASTTIELGHATDTTLSRSTAGVLAVEGVVIPSISSTNTLTNKRITKRTGTTTSSATPTINTDNVDEYYITAQAADITSMTTNLSGTPTLGQGLFISVIGTAARAITWGASFANGPVALPTTTVTTTQLSVFFKWDGSIWRCYATGSTV